MGGDLKIKSSNNSSVPPKMCFWRKLQCINKQTNNFIIVSILQPCTSALLIGETEDRFGIWRCWFSRRPENRSTQRKTSWSKDENQPQTQPTYDTRGPFLETSDNFPGPVSIFSSSFIYQIINNYWMRLSKIS